MLGPKALRRPDSSTSANDHTRLASTTPTGRHTQLPTRTREVIDDDNCTGSPKFRQGAPRRRPRRLERRSEERERKSALQERRWRRTVAALARKRSIRAGRDEPRGTHGRRPRRLLHDDARAHARPRGAWHSEDHGHGKGHVRCDRPCSPDPTLSARGHRRRGRVGRASAWPCGRPRRTPLPRLEHVASRGVELDVAARLAAPAQA